MVKITPRALRRPHVAADLATLAGRARAWRELIVDDHGILRLAFRNLHRISPEMWRSNQPSPGQIHADARRRGIRTIINLRGPSTRGFYLLEREACQAAGIALIDFQVYSREPPSRATIAAAGDLFNTIAYPALIHCKSGADRAGMMAVLYKLLREKAPYAEARAQLSGRYLHVRQGRTGVLDAVFEAYEAFNSGRDPDGWMPFIDWALSVYDPAAVKADFLKRFGQGFQLDRLLGRE